MNVSLFFWGLAIRLKLLLLRTRMLVIVAILFFSGWNSLDFLHAYVLILLFYSWLKL